MRVRWVAVGLVFIALVGSGCADLEMDDALQIYDEFQPQADPCRIPDSVECAAAGVGEEIDKEKEAADLHSGAIRVMGEDPDDALEKLEEAIELRPLDPNYRRTRVIIDVAGGRDPSAIDLLVFGREKDPVEAQMELATFYAFSAQSSKFEEGTTGHANLTQAFCTMMEMFKESGALNNRPASDEEKVDRLWTDASTLCSLGQ